MQVTISGHHMNTGSSLQEYVTDRALGVILKYFPNAVSTNVLFEKRGHLYVCDINLNEGTGRKILVRSSCSSDDPYSSFDSALMKLEKQLRKYKSKINDKSSRVKTVEAIEVIAATKYTISPTREVLEEDAVDENPVIIAEKQVDIQTLSVSDAVMKMDLENLPALMFKNIKNGKINVVYYRKDGNISWIDNSK
jgi:ribosomal subunit interface protein